ncbi:MAG: S8 family serine peptidase [Kiritimatiellia bacterium]
MPSDILKYFFSALFSILWLFPPSASAFYFRLDGDRLWLQAKQTPLVEVLEQFARAGVDVRLDPRIQSTVTGIVLGAELDETLASLLESYDYLLTWKVLRGPLGRVPKLHEIQVFLPGSPAAAQPLPRKSAAFDATRGVLGTAPEFVKDDLLVGVREGTTYGQFKRLLDEIGGMIVEVDWATGVYLIRFPTGTNVEALLRQLSGNPIVAHAELNHVFRLPTVASASPSQGRTLPPVSPPSDGSIPVAVLDSGLDPNAGLSSILSAGWDAVDPDRALADSDGHGTQMAYLASGLLAADGAYASGDVLPLVSIRAFDDDGKTSTFAILQSLAYAAKAGAKVVNMSWGAETESDFLRTSLQTAYDQGLILVASAGNEPTGISIYPAAYSTVVAVAGVDADGQTWKNSNYGDFVDLSASATATLPSGNYAGTSISSAVVANALAQYMNAHPDATRSDALSALENSLSPAPSAGYGKGVLDSAALQRFLSL